MADQMCEKFAALLNQLDERLNRDADQAALQLRINRELQEKVESLENLLTEYGVSLPQSSTSLTYLAIQAAAIVHFGNIGQKQRYLMKRGWTANGSGWWTNKALGYEQLLFEKAIEVQAKSDLSRFHFLVQDVEPKLAV